MASYVVDCKSFAICLHRDSGHISFRRGSNVVFGPQPFIRFLDPAGWRYPDSVTSTGSRARSFRFVSGADSVVVGLTGSADKATLIVESVSCPHPIQLPIFQSSIRRPDNGVGGRLYVTNSDSLGVIPLAAGDAFSRGDNYLVFVNEPIAAVPRAGKPVAIFLANNANWLRVRDSLIGYAVRPMDLELAAKPYLMVPSFDRVDEVIAAAEYLGVSVVMLVASTWYDRGARDPFLVTSRSHDNIRALKSRGISVILHGLPFQSPLGSWQEMYYPYVEHNGVVLPTGASVMEVLNEFCARVISLGVSGVYFDGMETFDNDGVPLPHRMDRILQSASAVFTRARGDGPFIVGASGTSPLSAHLQARQGQADLWEGLSQPQWRSTIGFIGDALLRRAQWAHSIGRVFDFGWWGANVNVFGRGQRSLTVEECVVYMAALRELDRRDGPGVAACMYASPSDLMSLPDTNRVAAMYREWQHLADSQPAAGI